MGSSLGYATCEWIVEMNLLFKLICSQSQSHLIVFHNKLFNPSWIWQTRFNWVGYPEISCLTTPQGLRMNFFVKQDKSFKSYQARKKSKNIPRGESCMYWRGKMSRLGTSSDVYYRYTLSYFTRQHRHSNHIKVTQLFKIHLYQRRDILHPVAVHKYLTISDLFPEFLHVKFHSE